MSKICFWDEATATQQERDATEEEELEIAQRQAAAPAAARAEKWEAIKAHRDRLSDQGGYLVDGKWFHSDPKSKTQQLGLARKADKVEAAGGDMTVPFAGLGPGGHLYWKTMDGSFVPMTPTLAQSIFAAAETQDSALFAVAEQHRAAMEASADPAGYDFSGGWPVVYVEPAPTPAPTAAPTPAPTPAPTGAPQ